MIKFVQRLLEQGDAYEANGFDSPAHLSESIEPTTTWRVFPGNWDLVFDGLAIVNTGGSDASIVVRQVRNDGGVIASRTIVENLGPAAKYLYVPANEFQAVAETYFEIQGTQPLAVTSIRGTYASSGFVYLWENKAIPVP